MRNHKWAALPLAITMLLSSAPVVHAAGTTQSQSTLLTKDQAIQLVQQTFGLGDDYEIDTAGSSDDDFQGSTVWELSFIPRTGNSQDFVTAEVEQTTGEILSFTHFGGNQKSASNVSSDVQHAQAIAWLKKLQPDKFAQMKESSVYEIENALAFMDLPDNGAVFHFVRESNGIPFYTNGADIAIDGNGNLIGYQFDWTAPNVQLPDPSTTMSQTQATASYEAQLPMQLSTGPADEPPYLGPTNLLLYTDGMASSYSYLNMEQPVLDVQTGQLVDRFDQPYQLLSSSAPVAAQPGPAPATSPLDQAGALRLAQQYTQIDPTFTLAVQKEEKWNKTWNFVWNAPKDSKSDVQSVSEQVSEENGELVGLSIDRMHNGGATPPTPTVTWAQARDKAVAFVKQALPTQVNSLYVTDNEKSSIILNLGDPTYEIGFVSIKNGVADGGAIVNVNAVTGDIMEFDDHNNQQGADSPNPQLAMSVQAAKDKLLQKYPLELQYIQTYDNGSDNDPSQASLTESKVVLAYAPTQSFEELGLDAISGRWVDEDGHPESKEISDIQGHWAASALGLMADYGVFSLDGDKVHPDQTATREEAIHALILADVHTQIPPQPQSSFGDIQPSDPNHDFIEEALSLGVLSQNDQPFRPNDQLTRLELAKWVAKLVGPNKDAQTVDPQQQFSDLAGVDQAGLDAISTVLNDKIMTGSDGKFDPNGIVTRAQLAVVAANLSSLVEWQMNELN